LNAFVQLDLVARDAKLYYLRRALALELLVGLSRCPTSFA